MCVCVSTPTSGREYGTVSVFRAVGRTVEGTIGQGVLLDKSPAGIEEFTARGLLCGVPFPAGEVCRQTAPVGHRCGDNEHEERRRNSAE